MINRNKLMLLLCLCCMADVALSQGIVKGKVVSDGQPLPGVNVMLQDSGVGTVTDFDGQYTLELADPQGAVLVFSYLGFETVVVQVSGRATLDVEMVEGGVGLKEVVVTALGIPRDERALGYALTRVEGEDFSRVKTTTAVSALQGRVAGVNVSQGSTGTAGSSRVIIRGASSLSGNNQPLYIVDGIPIVNSTKASVDRYNGEFGDGGDDISSINPDDIESVSVLKGSSAAALYGSQASNGVIMITTKSGKGKKGIGVELSSSYTMDRVNTSLQDFQTQYGQGRSGLKPGFIYDLGAVVNLDDGTPQGLQDAHDNSLSTTLQSWGAAYDGSPAMSWNGTYQPYSRVGDNVDKYYRTGFTAVNTVALIAGGTDYNMRLSASFLDNNDVFPNSTLDRQSYAIAGGFNIKPKLRSTVNVKYIKEDVHNRVGIGDGPGNANNSVLLLPDNIDVTQFRPGYTEEGTELRFNASQWFTNPYWVSNKFNNNDKKTRIIASTTLRYDVTDWLYLYGRAGIDRYDLSVQRVTPWGTAYRANGNLTQIKSTYSLFDADLMLGIQKQLVGKVGTHIILGGNSRKNTYEALIAAGDNFIVVGLEDLNNTTNPLPSYGFSEKQINSLYASFELDYDQLFFLTLTGRNDWFSSLSFPGKTSPNNDFYWSLSGSMMVDDILGLTGALDYLKLRASYAQVAGDTNPYALNLDYAVLGTFHGQAFGQINGATIPNPDLVPLQKNEFEVGADLRFFGERLFLDAAYYKNETLNDIVSATATGTSGYTSALLNVGELQNKGVEVLLGGVPIRTERFSWQSSVNLGYNDSEIVSTNDEGNPISMQLSRSGNANIAHIVGQDYGVIMGEAYKRDDAGNIFYEIDGLGIPRPVRMEERQVLGKGVAPLTAGFSNSFRYGNFNLDVLVDGKFGGDLFSGTNEAAYLNGKHKSTLPGRDGGLEVSGIDNTTGQPFTMTVPARNLGSYYGYIASENTGIAEEFIYSSDFIKLREVSLGYSFAQKTVQRWNMSELRVSLIGRNLLYFMKDVENVDPEASINNTNSQGLERFGVPASRSLGLSFNVKF